MPLCPGSGLREEHGSSGTAGGGGGDGEVPTAACRTVRPPQCPHGRSRCHDGLPAPGRALSGVTGTAMFSRVVCPSCSTRS